MPRHLAALLAGRARALVAFGALLVVLSLVVLVSAQSAADPPVEVARSTPVPPASPKSASPSMTAQPSASATMPVPTQARQPTPSVTAAPVERVTPVPAPSATPAPVPATPAPVPATPAPAPTTTGNVLLVVGESGSPNGSELEITRRLNELGYAVDRIPDEALAAEHGARYDLIVISKTVESSNIVTKLKAAPTGVIFWEDNAQALDMFATIDSSNMSNTAWHHTSQHVAVSDAAPASLRAGLSGTIRFYVGSNEITYAPRHDDGTPTLPGSAIRVAEFNTAGSGLWSLYAYEAGAGLADGTVAAGRRYYFGLYDDTFQSLTTDGLALWDAAVAWTAR